MDETKMLRKWLLSFNRDIVECKAGRNLITSGDAIGFNRDIVECKDRWRLLESHS